MKKRQQKYTITKASIIMKIIFLPRHSQHSDSKGRAEISKVRQHVRLAHGRANAAQLITVVDKMTQPAKVAHDQITRFKVLVLALNNPLKIISKYFTFMTHCK
jgi:hypothetical protein